MSKNLMTTEPGGEQTQYEGTHTFVEPHAKQGGQLATTSHPTTPAKPTDEPNTQGVSTADKIRYGQSIQEGGAGGKTNASGVARMEVGFGGAAAMEDDVDPAAQRRAQGYTGESEMDRSVGA